MNPFTRAELSIWFPASCTCVPSCLCEKLDGSLDFSTTGCLGKDYFFVHKCSSAERANVGNRWNGATISSSALQPTVPPVLRSNDRS